MLPYILWGVSLIFAGLYLLLVILEYKDNQKWRKRQAHIDSYVKLLSIANKALEKYKNMEHINKCLIELQGYKYSDWHRRHFVSNLEDMLTNIQMYNLAVSFWNEYFDLILDSVSNHQSSKGDANAL